MDLKTEIVMTANFREWLHFFRLRTDKAAHPKIRVLAQTLLDDVRSQVPVLFDSLGGEPERQKQQLLPAKGLDLAKIALLPRMSPEERAHDRAHQAELQRALKRKG